jgi:heptaprenyl diphosphate synthase
VNVVELLGLPALEEQLQFLEPLLVDSVVTGDDFLDEVTTHLLAAGGKRLRPVLALATATSGTRPATGEDLLGAVAVELVHLASLYHDDVMDEATVRRNVESVNARFGNLVAIVAGDFLLARSAEIAAGLGTEIAALLASTLGELCQGQVAEVHAAFKVDRSERSYSSAIAGKTAALMATSCRIGALTGGRPRPEVDAFTEFGRHFGMVFQIRDDILDIVGTDAELGKPAGQDVAEGIYTLPVLLALCDPDVGPELGSLLGQPLGQPERDKVRSMVAGSEAIAGAVTVARGYADLAASAANRGPSAGLAAGFVNLAHALVDDLPGS